MVSVEEIAVTAVMSSDVVSVAPDSTLEAAARRMAEHNVGSAAVLDPGGKLVGILTERDVLRAVAGHDRAEALIVSGCMSRVLVTVTPDTPVDEAMQAMAGRGIRHLPVLAERALVGIVSMRDLVRAQVCPGVPDRARFGLSAAGRGA